MSLFNVKGKSVLVTGASQGIGFALASGYAREGAEVYLNARNPEKLAGAINLLKEKNLVVTGLRFDVTDASQVAEAIDGIVQHSGKIDVVINNAGIIRRHKMEDYPDADWEEVLRTDLTAPFIISKNVARYMISQGQGKIINICSLMSEIGRESVGAYTAAKGGLKMLTKNMAAEWGPHNIQVNGIGPGYIATPINEEYRAPGNPLNRYILSRTPAGRWGTPDDLIGAAIFLGSAASDYVNGHILYVDGGVLATFGNPNFDLE
jgi:gluconate 5-dehydrogenase